MLNKRATYGDDWGVPSAEHPAGECLNRSAPGVEDGSYFEKAWVNDLMALPGAIMNAAGYTPNGTEDTATASQVFDALSNLRWSSTANYSPGSRVVGSDGFEYICKIQNGRDTEVKNPVGNTSGDWIKVGVTALAENINGWVDGNQVSIFTSGFNFSDFDEIKFVGSASFDDSPLNARVIASSFPPSQIVSIGAIISEYTTTLGGTVEITADLITQNGFTVGVKGENYGNLRGVYGIKY